MRQHYTEEQANAILRRAIERMPMKDEMSREQLEAIANEIGVSPDALSRAEAELLAEESDRAERLVYAAGKRLGFYKHLVAYVICIFTMALVSVSEEPDSVMATAVVALLWGIGVACHALNAFNTSSAQYDASFTQWRINRRAHELTARDLGRIPAGHDS